MRPEIGKLSKYQTLTQASREKGLTVETLRRYADCGKIRSIRDPVGRRLLLRVDVEGLPDRRR